MKIFNLLPLVFCAAVQAMPAASPANAPALDARAVNMGRIVKDIKSELASLNLGLTNNVNQLLAKLSLNSATSDVESLLEGLVGNAPKVLGQLESIVDPLLSSLGLLGETGTTIQQLEEALNINGKSTIATLLEKLGVLPALDTRALNTARLVKDIKSELASLNLGLTNNVNQLLAKLSLNSATSDVESLLEGLVGDDATKELSQLEAIVTPLLKSLGLPGVTGTTIQQLEAAIDINGKSTIADLLKGLGVLQV